MKHEDVIAKFYNEYNAKRLWVIDGIQNTSVEEMAAFVIKGRVVILQKYREGGWEVYAPVSDSNDVETTLQELEKRLSDDPHEIQIDLEGGVIHDVSNIPKGIHVKIRDFDTDGVDAERITENGRDPYIESIWIGGEKDVTLSDEAQFLLSQPKS